MPIFLPAAEYLEATKDKVSGNHEQGIRHPVATYNVSVQGVISAANELMADLEKGYPLVGDRGAERVLSVETLHRRTKQLILAMGEHVDACEKIIGCYLSNDQKNLKKAKSELRDNLGWYERHVMAQANHIKHRHAQVRSITMSEPRYAVPGYYIEAAIGEGVVGPDLVVHGKENAAFSYAREIRLLVCGLFYISRSLASVLRRYAGEPPQSEPKEANGLIELLDRVARYPAEMFPDEYKKKMPVVAVSAKYVHISFGLAKTPLVPYRKVRFMTQTAGDGETRSFQIPYLNMKRENG